METTGPALGGFGSFGTLGLYTNKLRIVRERSWAREVHQLYSKITLTVAPGTNLVCAN